MNLSGIGIEAVDCWNMCSLESVIFQYLVLVSPKQEPSNDLSRHQVYSEMLNFYTKVILFPLFFFRSVKDHNWTKLRTVRYFPGIADVFPRIMDSF